MQLIIEWITNIILLILLATILELLLPNSSMQRYVKMVVGLLLLVMILNPLLSIFSKDVNEIFDVAALEDEAITVSSLENSIESKKVDIESGQRAYISEQVAVQLKRQVEEELVDRFDVEVTDVVISMEQFAAEDGVEEQIDEVSVIVKQREHEVVSDSNEGIESVEVVAIDTTRKQTTEEIPIDVKEVLAYLETEWQISKEKISLAWEGG
ncbi:stage III sporulation protein AF [Desertibacillus haloalkaliphilus]|uniref:stage III sporulation protein AF n=1 Tax=Desertibacillus haloalkaliphilus TaxID=1328930 RepID=UPI001C273BAC|nr:stage III sporulation protein AF [Desertibacillus haloalkaliphilus]MBU8907726.1 stage III sporulation protein AF [Desertibacillus haloalkaliphilus]